MTNTERKLNEARYFFATMERLFNEGAPEFEFHLNAFINSSRNVTFVMQKEYAGVNGFNDWWVNHPSKGDEVMKKFVDLRNISLKEKSVRQKMFTIIQSFGPDGLHVEGKNGPTSVKSDPIRFDGPIPDHGFVTVQDDNGTRRVRYEIIHDFSIEENYENGNKQIQFDNFLTQAKEHLVKLEDIVEECKSKFSSSTPSP